MKCLLMQTVSSRASPKSPLPGAGSVLRCARMSFQREARGDGGSSATSGAAPGAAAGKPPTHVRRGVGWRAGTEGGAGGAAGAPRGGGAGRHPGACLQHLPSPRRPRRPVVRRRGHCWCSVPQGSWRPPLQGRSHRTLLQQGVAFLRCCGRLGPVATPRMLWVTCDCGDTGGCWDGLCNRTRGVLLWTVPLQQQYVAVSM